RLAARRPEPASAAAAQRRLFVRPQRPGRAGWAGAAGAARAVLAGPPPRVSDAWRKLLLDRDEEAIAELVRSAKRIAVLGIKTEAQANQPAFYVPRYLQDVGLEVIPVPVYYPDVTSIL